MVKGILIEEQFDSTNENGQLALFSSHFRKEAIIMKEITTEKLQRFNLIMGGLHLIQGIAMLFLATNVIQKIGEFSPEISQFYLAFNPETRSLETASRVLFELPFGVMVASFLFISAIAHALVSIPKKLNEIYNADLAKGINKFRWFEYSLSSSIMIVLIATLFGIYDIASLILIFIVNATMNLFGLVMEQLNVGRSKDNIEWGPFIWGSIAGVAPWIAILLYMFGTGNFGEVPWFVWAIVGTYFVAFNTFPINMILQYKKVGKWADYLYGERVYIVLSLVAKSILAWLVLFGAMQP
ncbi:heliorhodopsin HeR [Trichococcus flocculiformis]|uniref:heliorhodopsin HeR n=1 Tax=Trichococcus flocculiformis TaxID=82803 RepID=UPI002AAA6F01|nr:heliorhodopsin HeR [Trichococcus flocculiformis]